MFYNDLSNNLKLCLFYEVLGCVVALVKTAQLTEQSMALCGHDYAVRI